MFEFFKISLSQIFSKSRSNFTLYFAVISLAICLSALTLVLSLSQGFKDEINLKLSSIDGHYRINNFNYSLDRKKMSPNSLVEIRRKIDFSNSHYSDSAVLSYSEYTEDYALANIFGKSEGLLVYGIDSVDSSNVFNVKISPLNNKFSLLKDIIPVSIGSKLARDYNLRLGDTFSIFPINIDKIGSLPTAAKVSVYHIFNSGFSEYDKSVCFMNLEASQLLFGYSSYVSGIIGEVKNPDKINDQFSIIFRDINHSQYDVTTWLDRHESVARWLEMYSDPILFIIMLIVILAAFNMSLSLWILIQDRLKEISILFTLGFTKKKIALLVMFQNAIFTSLSLLIAALLSFSLLFIQHKYRLAEISQEIYFINYLPVGFDCMPIFKYYIFFFLLSIIISIVPAFKLYSISIIKHLNSND